MKRLLSLLFVAGLIPACVPGCQYLPKDALVRNVKIGATPWTPSMDAELVATGKAAANLTAEERKEIFNATKK